MVQLGFEPAQAAIDRRIQQGALIMIAGQTVDRQSEPAEVGGYPFVRGRGGHMGEVAGREYQVSRQVFRRGIVYHGLQ